MGYSDPMCHLFWWSWDCRFDACHILHGWSSLQIPSGARAPDGVSGLLSPARAGSPGTTEAQVQLQRLCRGCGRLGGQARSRNELCWFLYFSALAPFAPTVKLPRVEKNSSISLCSSWFLFSASSHAHSECLSFILPGSAPQPAKTVSWSKEGTGEEVS